MSDSIFKLQLLVRSEIALTKIYAKRFVVKATCFAIGLVFFFLALIMVNYALYIKFSAVYDPVFVALSVAGIDVVIALLVIFLGGKLGPSTNEEKMAIAIREMAYQELNADVEDVKGHIIQLKHDMSTIRSAFASFISGFKFFLSFLKKTKSEVNASEKEESVKTKKPR